MTRAFLYHDVTFDRLRRPNRTLASPAPAHLRDV
jgi:hypothetical protein